MALIDLYDDSPWALVPSKLEALRRIAEMHDRGQRIDLGELRNDLIREHGRHDALAITGLDGAPDAELPYQVLEGQYAVINVVGTMMARSSIMGSLSGGCSAERCRSHILDASERDSIKGIFLNVDSPGGNVHGTMELGEAIYRARESKPIHAYTSGMMCSAAYWVGSAAHRITAIATADIGSIGVILAHVDRSEEMKERGLKVTYIKAGKYKATGNPYSPLSDDDKEILQAEVDYLYSLFVENVARNLGVSIEVVLRDMADARIFIGQQAVDAGLVDAVGTVDDAFQGLRDAVGDVDPPAYLLDVN